jgi:hypothetical protein
MEVFVLTKKLTFEHVYNYIKNEGYVLLANKYINSSTSMLVKCPDNHEYRVKFNNFKSGKRCPKCAIQEKAKKFKFSFDEVEKVFSDNGCTLLSKEYINTNTPLDYVCDCGNESTIRFSEFKRGNRCRKCLGSRLSEHFSHGYEFVKNYFRESGCILLSDSYTNSKEILNYLCSCGNKSSIAFDKFKMGQRCYECRNRKIGDNLRGREFEERRKENHPNWNPNKTDEERLKERKFTEYHDWRKQVFENDLYTCQCCDEIGHDLNAHHLDGWNWCIEKRLDISNGITLCKDCHNEFHLIFGKGKNTEEQFNIYLKSKTVAI